MIVGFNHNVRYKGVLYHIQTEDSGVENPVITTLLYRSGTILASKRTSYSDIVASDKMGEVVKEIMKEQHKMMLLDLNNGVFDDTKEKPDEKVSESISEPTRKDELSIEESVIAEKPLDEVILDYLASEDTDSD